MIRNLRDKLGVMSGPKTPAMSVEAACLVRDTAAPLADYAGLEAVTTWHARVLGGLKEPFDLSRALFVDTETTGLGGAGTVAFLIGAGFVEGERFVVRQLLMRDYPQERAQLTLFAELMRDRDWIVSFNGKSFDMPLLESRFTMQRMDMHCKGMPEGTGPHHLDLLHPARRVWKLRLPDCKLQRLETEVLGFERPEDLPSAEVPQRFFDYLKTGDMALLEDVLVHNLQDIRTLALLLVRLAKAHEEAEQQPNLLDVFSLGRSFDRAGEIERARSCFEVASKASGVRSIGSVGPAEGVSGQARWRLADSYRRGQEHERAATIYEQMIAHGEGGIAPYVRLAILAEHQQKDARCALSYTRQAMLRAGREELPELEKRRERLCRKLSREER